MGSLLLDLLYPPRCPVCDGLRPIGEPACHPDCMRKIKPVTEPVCLRCGKPVSDESEEYCRDCAGKERSFERGVSAFLYEGDMRESMMRFKFHGREEYAAWYAERLMAGHGATLRAYGADAVVPVPIHRRKMRTRGYNQAERIARELAAQLSLPLYPDLLRRNRFTLPQKELDDRARIRNLVRAMEPGPRAELLAKEKRTPERVLLVDDIYTTGSTLEACTRVLLSAGVQHVMVVTVCIGSGYT